MINLQNNSRFGIKEMDVTLVTRFLCAMVNLMESRNWVSEGLIRFYCKGKGEKGKEKNFFFLKFVDLAGRIKSTMDYDCLLSSDSY